MVRTPIPRSTGRKIRSLFSASLGLILWRAVLVVVLVALIVLLASMGIFGAAIAGIILATLIRDDVQAAIGDLWHLRFWRFGS